MKKGIIWIVAIVVVVGAIAARVVRRGGGATAESIEQIHAREGVPVDVTTVRAGTITVYAEVTGVVSGIRQSVLRAPGDYKIAAVLVVEGDRVRRGQTLARFDTDISPDRMARLAQARESYDNAKRQLDRLVPLLDQGAVAESDLDAARTRLAIAEADLRDARLELEVVSPIDGIATLVACRRGDAVESGDVLAQVAVLDSVRVVADVSGETARGLRSGQKVLLDEKDTPPDARPRGTLTRVALGGDPDTRLFRVEATLVNPGERLRPGLVITVDVVTDEVGPVTVMSESAIVGDEDVVPGSQQDVWVVRADSAHRTTLQIGQVSQGLVEVRSGLDDGDRVVVFGANRLREGVRVRLHRVDGEAMEATGSETEAVAQ